MPRTERIAVILTEARGKITQGEIERMTWTDADVRKKSFRFGGTVLLFALLMIPIPIVHFAAIPVALLGAPIVFVAVYKLYSGASEIKGRAPCPSCGAVVNLDFQIDRWPIHEVCPQCRDSYVIDKRPHS